MMDASLRGRARAIIAGLEAKSPRSEATTLEVWMAHYIAELMYRAQDPTAAASERASSARECADVVRELWQLQLMRELSHLGHSLYQDQWRAVSKTDSALADAIRRPRSVSNWPDWKRLTGLLTLAQVDEDLIRALYLGSLRRATATGRSRALASNVDEAGHRRSQEQRMGADLPDPKTIQVSFDRSIKAVGPLFPEIAKTDLSDVSRFNAAIISALQRTFRLRARLLEKPLHVDEADGRRRPPDSAAK